MVPFTLHRLHPQPLDHEVEPSLNYGPSLKWSWERPRQRQGLSVWDKTLLVGLLRGEVPLLRAFRPQTCFVHGPRTGACEDGQGHSDTCWGF